VQGTILAGLIAQLENLYLAQKNHQKKQSMWFSLCTASAQFHRCVSFKTFR